MTRVRLVTGIALLFASPGTPSSAGEEMAHDPDPPPIYNVRLIDPNMQYDPNVAVLYMTYTGIECTQGYEDPSWAGYCIGSYHPDYCGDYSQMWVDPWEAFGSAYYQDLACYGIPIDDFALYYDSLDSNSNTRTLELPTYRARLEAIEGLDCLHGIPLDVYSGPTPPVAAARYHIAIPGNDSTSDATKSGILVWLSAYYDPSIFTVDVTHATFDPNLPDPNQDPNFTYLRSVTRRLDSGKCMMFRPRGSSWFGLSTPSSPLKETAQHVVPTYKIFHTTYRRRGWIKIGLRAGLSINDAAGGSVRLRVHTLNWVGSIQGCPEPYDVPPWGPIGGDRWSYRLTDDREIGVCADGQVKASPADSKPLQAETPIDTIPTELQRTADEVPIVQLVNEGNADLPSIEAGHCRFGAQKTLKNSLSNVAYYHRYTDAFDSDHDVVRLNIAGVWFCHDDVPGWYVRWLCYVGFYYLQVVDPIGNTAY